MALFIMDPVMWSYSVILLVLLPYTIAGDGCMIDESDFSVSYLDLLATTATRYVSPRDGMDVPHCLCLNVSCSTISYALFGNNTSTAPHNLTIILGPGTHVIDYGGIELHNASYVSFIGSESTIVECYNNLTIDDCSLSNILIKNSSFVNFYGITFQNCQSVSSFIHVERSSSVIFDRCTFRNNPRGAFHLYEAHSIAFHTCTFVDNVQVPLSDLPHCNAINSNDIFFLDSRATAGAISVYSYKHSLKLLIADSTFIRNSALDDDDDIGLPRALLTFGHGGAIFIRFVESSDSIVCITNSLFVNNTAQTNGGAIQLSAANSSTNNVIHVYDTQFIGNNCTIDTCTGGAIGIDYFKHSNLNFLTFINCSFRDNLASAGGAIALLTSVPTTLEDKERRAIWFNNCTFDHNIARHDGSALSFLSTTSINSLRFPVYIDQCGFLRNVALFSAEQITHSVSTFRIDLYFINETLFYDNFGGGLKLIESQIKLIDQLVLSHNFANDGGGIALYGKCILQLYADSTLVFSNNYALNNGGGLYVEYITSDFIFSILNRGCFMQYEDLLEDVPPDQWATNVQFISNTAGIAGAAIYASDMSRCQWFGEDSNVTRLIHNTPIFVPVEGYNSPFNFSGNRLARVNSSNITQVALSTNAYNLEVVPEDINVSIYSYVENAKFRLSALDQLNNTREAVWQVDAPLENEPLGAISSNTTSYSYGIPSEEYFMNEASSNDSITLTFSIFSVSSLVQPVILDLPVSTCHPGYMYNNMTGDCQCTINARQIVRCDRSNRYFYVKEGQWVYTNGSITVYKATIPSYLNCEREQNLPGCLFRFDEPNSQCAQGRTDILCAQCQTNYSLTMDLLTCSNNCNDIAAGVLFIVICILTVGFSLIVLYFDIAIPNELKGFIFFAQVIGVIYRNTPYVNRNVSGLDAFIDFVINMFGSSLPFPVCFKSFSGAGITWLGMVPPFLALSTSIIYIICAQKIKFLYERKIYGFHGLHFITLFIYKYIIDNSFAFANVRRVYGDLLVFSYTGQPITEPVILSMLIIGLLFILIFAIIGPIVLLVYIYHPQNHPHLADAFTRGIKNERSYIWYGVWDIWRRLPFVAINLLISVVSVPVILFLHCVLVLIVLVVHCITKPYKQEYINIIELAILFCVFGATLAILDDNDIYIQRGTSLFFVIIPFIYGLVYTIFLMCYKIFKKIKPEFELNILQNKMRYRLRSLSIPDEQHADNENDNIEESIETSKELREPLLEDI